MAGKAGAIGAITGKLTPIQLAGSLATDIVKNGVLYPAIGAVGGAALLSVFKGKPAAAPPAAALPPGALPPGAVPQANTIADYVMYGSPAKQGLFGSTHWLLGGQQAEPGLIERGMNQDHQFRNTQLNAQIESQRVQNEGDIERQRLASNANTILGGQQKERDMYASQQNTMSNMAANMAAIVGGHGINNAARYGSGMVTPGVVAPSENTFQPIQVGGMGMMNRQPRRMGAYPPMGVGYAASPYGGIMY